MGKKAPPELIERIYAAVKAAGADGISVHAVHREHAPTLAEQSVRNKLNRLKKQGAIVILCVGHNRYLYFHAMSAVQSYQRANGKAAFDHGTGFNRNPPRKRAPMRAGWAPDAPAVVPPNVKFTVGPSPPPRFSEQTFPFIHGHR